MTPPRPGRWRWAASLLIPLGFIHLLVFLRIPVDVYLAAPAEQAVSLPEVLPLLAALAATSLLVVVSLIALVGYRVAGDVRLWLIALALALWIVDSFFARSYPLLDGTVPRIEPDRWRLLLEFALLFTLVVVLARWQRELEGPALWFIALLGVFNAWQVVSSVRDAPALPTRQPVAAAFDSPFVLSSERNLLVVLMDTFQSDFLDDVLENDPELRRRLDGFVLFTDALGVAPTTFLSLPAIHSGRYYDPERSMAAYFDAAVREDSFLSQLAANGEQTVLVNPVRNLCPTGTRCTRRDDLLRERRTTVLHETLYLLDIALMRAAPEFAKNGFYHGGRFRVTGWFTDAILTGDARLVRDDLQVLSRAAHEVRPGAARPTAVFIHLMTTHPPYVLDHDCSVLERAPRPRRDRATAQAACSLQRFAALLDALRAQHLYDSSLIVLLGDHGYASARGDRGLDSQRIPGDSAASAGTDGEPIGRLIGSANPLLLIKPPGARGPLRTSDREASLVDVPTTICALHGDCRIDGGLNLFAADGTTRRARRFLSYQWEHRFWDLGYIPAIDFYRVRGPLALPASWKRQPLGLRRRPLERIDASSSGRTIRFGAGWSDPESDPNRASKRWAVARQAQLNLLLHPDPARHVAWQIDLEFYTPEYIPDQAVTLRFNGKAVARRPLPNRMQIVSFRLPAADAVDGQNRIELEFAQLHTPPGENARTLASSLFSATLSEVERRDDHGTDGYH